jgi:hypothetical protein
MTALKRALELSYPAHEILARCGYHHHHDGSSTLEAELPGIRLVRTSYSKGKTATTLEVYSLGEKVMELAWGTDGKARLVGFDDRSMCWEGPGNNWMGQIQQYGR